MAIPRNIPVRIGAGRRRHALPETGGEHTLCGRLASKCTIDNAFPDCARCLRAIARLTAGAQ